MARYEEQLEPNLKPLSEVHNYAVEKGDPDPRGYTVIGPEGRRLGTVDDLIIDTDAMKVRYLAVDSSGSDLQRTNPDDRILLPVQELEVQTNSRQVVARAFTGNERSWSHSASTSEEGRTRSIDDRTRSAEDRAQSDENRTHLTRSEETLEVGKREVTRGEARIGKHIETEHVSEPVTRRREEVVIERRPVEAGARGDASITEDEVRIPLREEEVVVNKRPVVKEELVVGKRVVEDRDTVEADLRREEFDIDKDGTTTSRGRDPRRER